MQCSVSRMLHLPDDPQAVAVLDQWRAAQRYNQPEYDLWKNPREVLESLAARGIAPDDWTQDERVEALQQDWRALVLVLRNPRALITAERLLLDALDAAHAESVRASDTTASRGRYVGVRSWESLCASPYASDHGVYLPSANFSGLDHVRDIREYELDPSWLKDTRGTGKSYGDAGEHVWRMAGQIASGREWVTELYRTGLGLWCARAEWGAPEWVLIVRPGGGIPWPVFQINNEKTW